MSVLDKGLGVAVILLAGTTIYFAWRVGVESGGTPPAYPVDVIESIGGPGVAPDAPGGNGPMPDASGAPGDRTALRPPPAIPRGRGGRAPREVAEAIHKRAYELGLADPATRRQLIEELVPDLRDDHLILERRLQLGNARWQEFLELLAAQSVDQHVRDKDCGPDAECLRRLFTAEWVAERDQARIALLGNANHEAFKEFTLSMPERRGIATLQNRLPLPQRLSETTAEELAVALSEVRRDSEAEIYAAGGAVTRFNFGSSPTMAMPAILESTEDRLKYVHEYSQRMRDRAATLLNGAQLAYFNDMQDAMLAQMRRHEARRKPAQRG